MFSACRRTGAKGFTAIEIVVVLGIIAVLAGLVTTGTSWARCRAKEAQAASRASHLDQALELFHIKHKRYPAAYPAQLSTRLAPYLEEDLSDCVDNPKAFVAPAYPSAGADPLNKSYSPSSPLAASGRYVLAVQPGRPHCGPIRLARCRARRNASHGVWQRFARAGGRHRGRHREICDWHHDRAWS